MAELTFFSARICPFCQRSRLALREKGVDFELVEIDLEDKPDWYRKMTPDGRVPAVRHDELLLWESAIINGYLEDAFPAPPLLPPDPAGKALARLWVDFADNIFVPAFYKVLLHQEEEKRHHWVGELLRALRTMEKEGIGRLGGGGPFWFGRSLTLADLAFYPWFERWPVLRRFRELDFPADCGRLREWHQALAERPAMRKDSQLPEFYIRGYEKYAEVGAGSGTARQMKEK